MRTPRGSVKRRGTRYLARISWSENGRKNERWEYVDSSAAGKDRIREWRRQWLDTGTIARHPDQKPAARAKVLLEELAKLYREKYAKAPEYSDGRMIAGMRSWQTVRGHVDRLEELLGKDTDLDAITFGDLEDARAKLLKDVSPATANRHMSTARRMFKVARTRRMMAADPFHDDDTKRLINKSLERPRTRVMTPAEEKAIIAQCVDEKKRAHLRPVVIMAVETGMRVSEILATQRWREKDADGNEMPWIDWKERIIHVTEFYAKGMKARIVPMSKRLMGELKRWEKFRPASSSSLFGITSSIDTAWRGAKKDAGVKGLRFHDVRATASTRMLRAGIPGDLVSKILGHEDLGDAAAAAPVTKRHYTRLDLAGAQELGAKMGRRRAKKEEAVN